MAGTAAAQQDDTPVRLQADQARLDNATGDSVYTGNVELTRGELRITGERMEVFTDAQRRLQRIIVTGSPATYHDVPPDGGAPIDGEAPRMEYYTGSRERIVMTGGATLLQAGNRFRGETITYDPVAKEVQASGGEERIEILLTPAEGASESTP